MSRLMTIGDSTSHPIRELSSVKGRDFLQLLASRGLWIFFSFCDWGSAHVKRECWHLCLQLAVSSTTIHTKLLQTPFKIFFNICLFWAVLGLCHCTAFCCVSFSLVSASRGYFHCSAPASHCKQSTVLQGTLASGVAAPELNSCGSLAPEPRLSTCDPQAQFLQGTWGLPGPRMELVSPALAGGFFTTEPPGKSCLQPF